MIEALFSNPESPVDSCAFPSSLFETLFSDIHEHALEHDDVLIKSKNGSKNEFELLIQVSNQESNDDCVVYDTEIEPFGFEGMENNQYLTDLSECTEPEMSFDTTFADDSIVSEDSTVFSDADLVDVIVSSLGVPSKSILPTDLPAIAPIDLQRSMSLPMCRKPGTFLNKDGRWIKGKPCHMSRCDKRAQSNGLCKGHGGGARCSHDGCSKSSQGGGLCRAHGGGKRCMHEGCDKGTQRNGFCYLHGGVRMCCYEGCDKKDRGNGKCFAHGGGRRCLTPRL